MLVQLGMLLWRRVRVTSCGSLPGCRRMEGGFIDRVQTNSVELTIVMPCLNEAETLAICLDKAQLFLHSSGIAGEIVVGDNGSTDGSQAIALAHGARVIDVPIRGYGAALYAACIAARGRYLIMGDSDDSYDFSNLGAYVAKLRQGNDLVMGNRFAGEIKPGAMPWKNRYIGNPVLSGIGKLRHARLLKGRVPSYGPPHHRDGVCLGDGYPCYPNAHAPGRSTNDPFARRP